VASAKKNAAKQARQIALIDESGFYLVPGLVRSYAPCGDRPQLHPFLTRDHLSVISAVTPAGQLYSHTSDKALGSFEVTLFVQHLLEQLGCPLLLLWDGSPIHCGQVTDFIAQLGPQQIITERFPPYAPELNPDEGVWQYLKYVELRNEVCLNLRQLRFRLHRAIMRLRSKPALIRSFFAGAGLALD